MSMCPCRWLRLACDMAVPSGGGGFTCAYPTDLSARLPVFSKRRKEQEAESSSGSRQGAAAAAAAATGEVGAHVAFACASFGRALVLWQRQ